MSLYWYFSAFLMHLLPNFDLVTGLLEAKYK